MKKITFFLNLLIFAGNTYSQCAMVNLSLPERVISSNFIFEGRVVSKSSFWNEEHTSIFTANVIEVYKVFKGDISASEVELVTPGGIVGTEMEVATPSLMLNADETGIFFAQPSSVLNSPNQIKTSLKLEPYASSQGFIKYSLYNHTATDPFNHYTDIKAQLYQVIQSTTGKNYIEIKAFDPTSSIKSTDRIPATPTITSFSPTSITAGTLSLLTITGTNFGTSSASPAAVLLADADNGGASYNTVLATDIVSWTNTQIQIKVPSKCGTGPIEVTNSSGITSSASSTTLTVPWGQLTVIDGNNVENQINMIDSNGSGGYTYQFCKGFYNNASAVTAFNTAIQTWICGTYANYTTSITPISDRCNARDGHCIVNFDSACPLATGILGITYSYYNSCNAGGATWYWTLSEMDIVFSKNGSGGGWNFGPGGTTGSNYDFQSTALHELGHAHGLCHVIDPPALMHWDRANATDVRILGANDTAGVNNMLSRSLISNPCGAPAHIKLAKSACNNTTGIDEIQPSAENVSIYPNPFSNSTVLHIASSLLENGNTVRLIVFNMFGNKVKTVTNIDTEDFVLTADDLSSGMYFYQVINNKAMIVSTGKLLLLSGK